MRRSLLSSPIEIAIAIAAGVSCLLVMSAASSKCIDGEREVLLKFKQTIHGKLRSWDSQNDCCDWKGVGCDNLTGHVVKIDLSGMYLSPKVRHTTIPFIELQYLKYLDLSSNYNLLENQTISSLIENNNNNNSNGNSLVSIQHLSLSQTGIIGTIPGNLGNRLPALTHLNLSMNGLEGSMPENFGNSMSALTHLDLWGNSLEGAIPHSLFNVSALYLSWNKFTELNSLCDIKAVAALRILDISFNHLSGTLPDCWENLRSLAFLNLANNHNLSGSLPTSIGSLASLEGLHLDHNNFTGTLPSSMKICSSLVVLHLGHNKLLGPIPDWVGENLTRLAVLVLRSNKFNASVPSSLCRLQSLQLLDLSVNHISGTLPDCLSNLTGMTVHEPHPSATISYEGVSQGDTIDIVWKGQVIQLQTTLGLIKSFDLSSNMLSGEIPTEITSLDGLVSLNLSRNNLRGQIPPRIDNLSNLETLDLSHNHLSGSIPQSLALIHRMSFLNVSNNNLSGKIPDGTQLHSFDASTYTGNLGLCGDPLPHSCRRESTHPTIEEADKFFCHEFYASMGVGYAVGFLGVIVNILFIRSCRFAYFKLLDDFANWAYVVAAIHKAKFVRILGG
ncbi:unnamed protein product [Cuscuta epithymum]|uniref:Leucine-rich repeat-containing N-terminal plant-type domain-containing protein n=1 Tax=Cuscuta epithymum TaxID=186058 RepID=A0AAV0FW06_9ASTE|nr:unnamed protein product [Cuscuta epithymum]